MIVFQGYAAAHGFAHSTWSFVFCCTYQLLSLWGLNVCSVQCFKCALCSVQCAVHSVTLLVCSGVTCAVCSVVVSQCAAHSVTAWDLHPQLANHPNPQIFKSFSCLRHSTCPQRVNWYPTSHLVPIPSHKWERDPWVGSVGPVCPKRALLGCRPSLPARAILESAPR